jgi:hypothetical protein
LRVVCLSLAPAMLAAQQNVTISGTVRGESGNALIGAVQGR